MNGRRGFLAFLGGASVTGVATTRASATAPTLILPPGIVPATAAPSTNAAYPLLSACETEMHAFLKVKRLTPTNVFQDWLEGGLWVARLYNGRTEAETGRVLLTNFAQQAQLQQREMPEEAHARVVRIVEDTARRWKTGRGERL